MDERALRNFFICAAAVIGAAWGVSNEENIFTIAIYAVAAGGVIAFMFFLISTIELIYKNVPPEE